MKTGNRQLAVGIRQLAVGSWQFWVLFSLFSIHYSLFITSCNPPPAKTKKQVIQERIENRVKRWKANVLAKYERDVMAKATEIADSTIKANARAQKDTLFKPLKPGHPDYEIPEDSIPIAPLIVVDSITGDTIFGDTLELELLQLLEDTGGG